MKIENPVLDQLDGWRRTASILLFCAAATVATTAQTFTNLVNFDSTNGRAPFGTLVQGLDGNFYGTTAGGGSSDSGTVFKVTPTGQLTTLHNFCSQTNCADGGGPQAGLILGTDGNFYGTTSASGGGNCPQLCGTVFKITTAGKLTTLYTFCSQAHCADGDEPEAGLTQAADGNFYGTTYGGGIQCSSYSYDGGCGTVFKMTPNGKLTNLYTFCSKTNCSDGGSPAAGLVQATDGNFYGTTPYDGNFEGCYSYGNINGCGTVFRVTPAGKLTVLYRFCALTPCPDGFQPRAGLLFANGEFYGTTLSGGSGLGTVFRTTAEGDLTTLHLFQGTDGFGAQGSLIQATDGKFYGTTVGGGLTSSGTIFEIAPDGSLTTLYSFCPTDCSDFAGPEAGLVQGTDGNFYGTTVGGGDANCFAPYGCGTVFSLSVGLGHFVRPNPTAGKIGNKVGIIGNNLMGAVYITFNGTPATFTVVSDNYIKAIVPTGATTGIIQVKTPSSTLTSNVPFYVVP
jgi:uncharacterized repeat protein (TIGR03803 family)